MLFSRACRSSSASWVTVWVRTAAFDSFVRRTPSTADVSSCWSFFARALSLSSTEIMMAEEISLRYPFRTRLPTMAFTATSSFAPFRSAPPPMSSRISWASSFSGVQERTFSSRFTRSSMLGFTSSDTTDATAFAC